MTLSGPGRALVLVAGIPGAGKSTLLRRLTPGPDLAVVDSESQRDVLARRLPAGVPYARYRPLVHVLHRFAIVAAAVAGPAAVVVHLPATGAFLRALLALLALVTGRVAYLVWLDVAPEVALAGQEGRGRIVPSGCFAAHARRARATSAALAAGHVPWGYERVLVLDRTARTDLLGVLASCGAVDGTPGK
ncbi:AAA family ATPase [Pseudonocardia sp.]|uniref:AAA family ATPase n=1 Tax=Pseudonocardia sp. TaxID=60912 RepID=UPI003D153519